jgi:hypothetical protein
MYHLAGIIKKNNLQNNLSLSVNDDEKMLNLNINQTVNRHFNIIGVNENVKT